jgi:hypothetical protein
MSLQHLSFNADHRSVQSTFYHFNEHTSGSNKRNFSQQDTLVIALTNVYETKFSNVSKEFRNVLVEILVSNVPLEHNNLTMLAAANYIIYNLRNNGINLNLDSTSFASPQCDSPQQYCITDSPSVVECKEKANSKLDPNNRNVFEFYFNYVEPFIMPDVSGKKPEEVDQLRALNKITLLRYIIYVQNNLPKIQNV